MNKKQKIIETAVELFNKNGLKSVTTNHIAAAADISPGNLYYHFRNKEEIIRAIFEMMDEVGMAEYNLIVQKHEIGTLEATEEIFKMIQKFNWDFRFFKRDISAILLSDPELHERYVKTHNEFVQLYKFSIVSCIEKKIFVPMTEKEIDLFAEELLLVMLFWLNYLEISKEKITDTSLARGNEVMKRAMWQCMTEEAKKTYKYF